eukprot:CAMPEP_0113964728 /NCGR_PEP_ID=MMETSP0011_2-20120614/7320_1 /TAXON_ID=101924 /ORGANISM="Rhodosorus marinus" /LENGTH=414 /DNA_ID=CAMNT_0000977101 /DNA_START=228 /DNA_END=1472 /DNA_ORIENTATION=- /assembly_acc=CAM_ASM_000156
MNPPGPFMPGNQRPPSQGMGTDPYASIQRPPSQGMGADSYSRSQLPPNQGMSVDPYASSGQAGGGFYNAPQNSVPANPMMQPGIQPNQAAPMNYAAPQNNFVPGPGFSQPNQQGMMENSAPQQQNPGFQPVPMQQQQQQSQPNFQQAGQAPPGIPNILGFQPNDNNFAQQMFATVSSQFIPEYGKQLMNNNQEQVKGFFRVPKPYFAVDNRYVLKKLFLILCPFMNKTWQRKTIDSSNYNQPNADEQYSRSIPRDDVNAPDLYIPVMALVTYVLLVGFISGTKGVFTPEKMASTASVAIGVVTFEVLLIRLGFYLVNAKSAPWLDFVAFRGYKFVGLVVSLLIGCIARFMYFPLLVYSATMMGLFLIRTYRRILLPSDQGSVGLTSADTATRNYFLLFIALLQYPLYWLLSVKP